MFHLAGSFKENIFSQELIKTTLQVRNKSKNDKFYCHKENKLHYVSLLILLFYFIYKFNCIHIDINMTIK